MNVLRSRFFQAVVIWVLAFLILRVGIRPPAPWSVLTLYLFIVTLALLVFVSADRDSWRDFVRPVWLTLTDERYRVLRTVIVFAVPLLLGYYAYTQAAAMPQEAFLFWRIAKGGPGLPKESTPWNSVMPAWEDRLTEEQIWQVILFLYDFTGYQLRRWEAAEHASH